MSLLTQLLSNVGGVAVDTFKPHVVITAPDGEQLWIPVSIPNSGGSGDDSSLLSGFKIKLAFQSIPSADHITDSTLSFASSQSLPLLTAWLSTPSPSGAAALKQKGIT